MKRGRWWRRLSPTRHERLLEYQLPAQAPKAAGRGNETAGAARRRHDGYWTADGSQTGDALRRPAAVRRLVRSLVKEPRLLLFDEPLSNLDASLRLSMRSEIGISQIMERKVTLVL